MRWRYGVVGLLALVTVALMVPGGASLGQSSPQPGQEGWFPTVGGIRGHVPEGPRRPGEAQPNLSPTLPPPASMPTLPPTPEEPLPIPEGVPDEPPLPPETVPEDAVPPEAKMPEPDTSGWENKGE